MRMALEVSSCTSSSDQARLAWASVRSASSSTAALVDSARVVMAATASVTTNRGSTTRRCRRRVNVMA
jgi:hypothetical protein